MSLSLNRLVPLWVAGCAGLFTGAAAQAARLNDTGQLTCLDADNQWTTDCSGSPMDAGQGRDRTRPSAKDGLAGFSYARVCNNGEEAGTGSCPKQATYGMGSSEWGCTRDKVSGLVWELKDTLDSGSRRALYGRYPWNASFSSSPVSGMLISDYVAWANQTAMCGRSDWRLPTLAELSGILRFGAPDAVNAAPVAETTLGFPDLQRLDADGSFLYTTFDGALDADGNMPYVFFGRTGQSASPLVHSGIALAEVRLVSGERHPPRFWVQGRLGEELLDRSTGLVWQRCRVGMRWNGKACAGTASSLTWGEALSTGSGTGWRLPNVKELTSVMTQTGSASRLNARFFPGLQTNPAPLWTATHRGELREWSGNRLILARQVSPTTQSAWWIETIAAIVSADGTRTDTLGAQVLLVKDQ